MVDVVKKQTQAHRFELENYAEYQLIECSTRAVDSLMVDVAYRSEQSTEPESHVDDLKGLMAMERIIESFKEQSDQYTEGLDDGRDLARSELEPIIKAMFGHIRNISDNRSFEFEGNTFELDYIEGRLTL